MNINWRTVLATVIGLAFGGGAAYAGIKYYDTHKPTFPGRRGGWTPPVEEEPISKEEAVTDDSEGSDEVVVVDSGSEPKAYVVDDSEFFYGEPEYEKNRDLIWYQESGVLIDDHDEIVANPEKLLGSNALDNMRYRLDGDMVYVRNDDARADFEIEVNAGEFNKDLSED